MTWRDGEGIRRAPLGASVVVAGREGVVVDNLYVGRGDAVRHFVKVSVDGSVLTFARADVHVPTFDDTGSCNEPSR